jgi:2,4-dienoyl-CoA reductase-like NADH-dependent reductase (Old Yellow Enzyme family)
MARLSALFQPITLRRLTLPNRIVVSPMCQCSAVGGCASDRHVIHLGHLALSGAGLLIIEATGVEPTGRISPGCLGLYSDETEAALARVLDFVRRHSAMPIGIQLGHAGRKASTRAAWEIGGSRSRTLGADEGGWLTVAPSAIPFDAGWHTPAALAARAFDKIVEAFARATARCVRLGIDLIKLDSAHGYLMSAIALGRAMLNDPSWPWHAAEALGATVSVPPPY